MQAIYHSPADHAGALHPAAAQGRREAEIRNPYPDRYGEHVVGEQAGRPGPAVPGASP
jgi:hypothetical protein